MIDTNQIMKCLRSVKEVGAVVNVSVIANPIQPDTWKNQNSGLKSPFRILLIVIAINKLTNEIT